MLICVCSPLRGERPYTTAKYNRNLQKAADYSAAVVREGHIPITPHLYFSHFIDDHKPQEREKGLEMSRELLRICDQVWVFSENGISDGMKGEINFAGQLGKTVLYK